jgi:hypothetical protein
MLMKVPTRLCLYCSTPAPLGKYHFRKAPKLSKSFRMGLPVAFPTEGNEVLLGIMPELTSRRNVVNF